MCDDASGRWFPRRAVGAAVLLLLGFAALIWTQAAAGDATAVAYVDGSPISRAAFDTYAGVFTDPSGNLRVSRGEVLLSLVNQELISRKARQFGIKVDKATIDEAMEEWASLGVGRQSLEPSGGEAGLRDRFEAFFELKQVKAMVVGDVHVSAEQVQSAYQSRFDLQGYGLEEVADVLRDGLMESEVERRWRAWLAKERACALIEVMDPSLGVASSSKAPEC